MGGRPLPLPTVCGDSVPHGSHRAAPSRVCGHRAFTWAQPDREGQRGGARGPQCPAAPLPHSRLAGCVRVCQDTPGTARQALRHRRSVKQRGRAPLRGQLPAPSVPHAAPKTRLPLPTPPGRETLPAVSSHACFSVCDAGAVARGALLPHVRREPHLARPRPGPPLRGEHPPARQEAGEDVTITQDAEQDGPAGSRPERSPHQHRPSPVSRPGDPAPGGGQAE